MFAFKRTMAEGWRVGVMPTDRETALAIVRRSKSELPLLRHCAIHPTVEIRAEHVLQPLNSNRELAGAAVSGVLGTNDYQLVQVEAPEVPPDELRSAVRWKLKDLIGYPVSEAVVDVFEVPENTRYVESHMVFAVAARAQAVEGVVNLLKPRVRGFDVLDIPEMCLRNVSALLPQDDSGVVLLALGEGFVQLTVTCRGVLYLARRIEMVRSLDLDERGAEEREVDIAPLALELQRSLDYYESHFDLPPITEVAVVAGDPRAEPLLASLHGATGLTVTALEVPELFEVAPGVEPDTRWPGLLALGAALRGTERSAA